MPHIHVVYEHGADLRPFGSAHVRLLRPLCHPTLRDQFTVTSDWSYHGEPADVVIVDRLWRPDLSLPQAEQLLQNIRRAGARFVYALDDDFFSLSEETAPGYFNAAKRSVVELWLREADRVVVTTLPLQQRVAPFNPRCVIVPNALDDRLLVGEQPHSLETPFGPRRTVIGYMGTYSHEADLRLILPAWRRVYERQREAIEFQVIGVSEHAQVLAQQAGVPVRVLRTRPEEAEYPLFMLWFTGHVRWDIAVAPLLDTPFTRCKSDLKFLDYSALGAATIASRVPVYEGTVRHGETGWLAENTVEAWVDGLQHLVADANLRIALAARAQLYLLRDRTLARRGTDWKPALSWETTGAGGSHW